MRDDVSLEHLADMVANTIEGGIVTSKALGQPAVLPEQIMLMRSYIRLMFLPSAN